MSEDDDGFALRRRRMSASDSEAAGDRDREDDDVDDDDVAPIDADDDDDEAEDDDEELEDEDEGALLDGDAPPAGDDPATTAAAPSGAAAVVPPPGPDLREIGDLAVWSVTSAKSGNGVELLRDGQCDTFWQLSVERRRGGGVDDRGAATSNQNQRLSPPHFSLTPPPPPFKSTQVGRHAAAPHQHPVPAAHGDHGALKDGVGGRLTPPRRRRTLFNALPPPRTQKTNQQELRLYLDHRVDESYTPSRLSVRAGTHAHDLKEVCLADVHEPCGWVVIPLWTAAPAPPSLPAPAVAGGAGARRPQQQQRRRQQQQQSPARRRGLGEEEEEEQEEQDDDDDSEDEDGEQEENAAPAGAAGPGTLGGGPPLRAFLLQVAVLSNHQSGRDTHVRQARVYGPRPARMRAAGLACEFGASVAPFVEVR